MRRIIGAIFVIALNGCGIVRPAATTEVVQAPRHAEPTASPKTTDSGHSEPKVSATPRIRLVFSGNHALSSESLEEAVTHALKDVYLPEAPTSIEDNFGPDARSLASMALSMAFYDRGFLGVEIDQPSFSVAADGALIVTFTIHEGTQYVLRKMTAEEVSSDGKTEASPLIPKLRLLRLLRSMPGAVFERSMLSEDVGRITTIYRDAGYGDVECLIDTQPLDGSNLLDVGVKCKRGKLIRIESIGLSGAEGSAADDIRKRITLTPGQLFSETQVLKSKAAIGAILGIKTVDVSVERGKTGDDRMIVNFAVASE